MKAQMNYNGKGRWSEVWGDKVKSRFKRIFSKSERQAKKKEILDELK